jgi:probable addiction module antidote protein
MKPKPYRSHEDATIASFRRDPKLAAAYINAVLHDGDNDELLLALRRLASAFGGVSAVAESAGVNKTSLYRALDEGGNPEIKTVRNVLRAMRLDLQVRSIESKPADEQVIRFITSGLGSGHVAICMLRSNRNLHEQTLTQYSQTSSASGAFAFGPALA